MADRDIRFTLSAEDTTRAGFRSVEAGLARIKAEAAGVAASFGGLGGALSVAGISAAFVGIGVSAANAFGTAVSELADLDDAAEKSGASVESLSSLLNTLAPTGVGLSQISDLAGKLTRAMVGAGEETSKAAEAFRLLGVSTKDGAGNLRAVDDVLVDLARALNGYADGTNKSALAQALLGKSGAEYLPLLKDLATRNREAATVTGEQAAKAEELANQWRALGVEATKLKQSIAQEIIPGLVTLITRFNEARTAGLGFYEALKVGAGADSLLPKEVQSQIEKLSKLRNELDALTARPEGDRTRARLSPGLREDVAKTEAYLTELLKRVKVQERLEDSSLRRFMLTGDGYGPKPESPILSGGDPEKKKQATREAISEAQRLLDTLTDQAAKTRDLTTEQEILGRIGRGAIEGMTPLLEQQILLQAVLIDNEKARKAGLDDLKKTIDELARAEEIEARTKAESLLSDDIKLQVRAFAEYKSLVAGSVEEQRKLKQAVLDVIGAQVELGNISRESGDELVNAVLEVKKPFAEIKEAAKDVFAPIESAFEAALFDAEKLSDVVKALAIDIAKIALRQQITGPLGNFLGGSFDAKKEGGTIFGQLLSGITGASGGPELLNAPIEMSAPRAAAKSAGVVMVNQTITYGNNGGSRAEAFAFGQAVKADTIRAIKESEARGA